MVPKVVEMGNSSEHRKRIYDEVWREKRTEFLQNVLAMLEGCKSGDTISSDEIIDKLHDYVEEKIDAIDGKENNLPDGESRDFLKEKELECLTSDGEIFIIPFREADKAFYYGIEKQWTSKYSPDSLFSLDNNSMWDQISHPYSLFCKALAAENPIGYLAIKDSRKPVWEVAAEFDKAYCYRGYGPRCISLFLHAIRPCLKNKSCTNQRDDAN